MSEYERVLQPNSRAYIKSAVPPGGIINEASVYGSGFKRVLTSAIQERRHVRTYEEPEQEQVEDRKKLDQLVTRINVLAL